MKRELVPLGLAVLAFVAGAIASPYFLDAGYLLDSSSLYVETGLLALGMTLVIVSGNIDLSVASIVALVACVTAKLLSIGWSPLFALPAGLALGTALGLFNGLLVARLRLPSFVVTLATMAAYRGVAQVMLGAGSERVPPELVGIDLLKPLGVPVPLVLLIFVALATGFLLHGTVMGRWIFSVGNNERASLFSGVPVERVKETVFAFSGLMAGIAGLLIGSRLGVARFDHARGLEIDVIATVILGGASIYGGKGSILGTMLALLLVFFIRTGLGVANVTSEYQLAAVGALLILAVMIGNLSERWPSLKAGATKQP